MEGPIALELKVISKPSGIFWGGLLWAPTLALYIPLLKESSKKSIAFG